MDPIAQRQGLRQAGLGHLYGETLQDLKYSYREWLRRTFGDSLRHNY